MWRFKRRGQHHHRKRRSKRKHSGNSSAAEDAGVNDVEAVTEVETHDINTAYQMVNEEVNAFIINENDIIDKYNYFTSLIFTSKVNQEYKQQIQQAYIELINLVKQKIFDFNLLLQYLASMANYQTNLNIVGNMRTKIIQI